jgi:DNA-binding NtrC family response regulator
MAATNVHIDDAVAAGRFREDLFFRLNVIRMEVPSLRDRREDIPMLIAHFLRHYAQRYKTAVRELPGSVQEAFLAHDWPGNVRELENAVRRYVILGDGEAALAELRRDRRRPDRMEARPEERPLAPAERETSWKEGMSLRTVAARAAEEAERHLLRRVLAETRWNRREAALRLKISYKALLNKLKKWDVDEPLRDAAAPLPVETPPPRLLEEPARAHLRGEIVIGRPRWPRTAAR